MLTMTLAISPCTSRKLLSIDYQVQVDYELPYYSNVLGGCHYGRQYSLPASECIAL
jgi:hypothetical protein